MPADPRMTHGRVLRARAPIDCRIHNEACYRRGVTPDRVLCIQFRPDTGREHQADHATNGDLTHVCAVRLVAKWCYTT